MHSFALKNGIENDQYCKNSDFSEYEYFLLTIEELANRICVNSIWIEGKFSREGYRSKILSVRPSVRTILSGHRTRLDEKSRKSSFFRGFSKN